MKPGLAVIQGFAVNTTDNSALRFAEQTDDISPEKPDIQLIRLMTVMFRVGEQFLQRRRITLSGRSDFYVDHIHSSGRARQPIQS
jgi:hypothetical protein